MTLAAPTFPIPGEKALQHLLDALGANYGGPVDDVTLTRALGVDALTVETAVHPRPWATAARLIRDNTEYELDKGLKARIDRKLDGLWLQQRSADRQAGIISLLSAPDEVTAPRSGAVDTRVVW